MLALRPWRSEAREAAVTTAAEGAALDAAAEDHFMLKAGAYTRPLFSST